MWLNVCMGMKIIPLKSHFSLCARCSRSHVKRYILSCIPLLSWLPDYPLKQNAVGDVVSGISMGVLHLPQGLAYAMLAAVPPVFGLYSCFYPMFIYFIFGTSRHISSGTYAVISVMIGGVTARIAPDSNFMILSNVSNVSIVDTVARDNERVKIAAAVTFLAGIIQLLLGLVNFGFVVTYLSEPLVSGYTTGTAIHAVVAQFRHTFGIHPKHYTGPLSLIYTVLDVFSLLGETNVTTLVVSLVAISGLVVAREVNACLASRLPIPVPVQFFALIIGTIVSWHFDFKTKYNVHVVGPMPSGLRAPAMPEFSRMGSVVGDAFAMAVVGYAIVISLGRLFSFRFGYKIDRNQELLALGLCNLIGGIFQCFAVSCAISRSMVQISTGGKTQVAGAISALVVLVFMLKIGKLFEDLPKAVLSAVVYMNVHTLLRQFGEIPSLWRKDRVDTLVWVMTFILTILLNPDVGLAASIIFSMLTVILRTQLSRYSLLGRIPGTDIYKPIEDYNQLIQIPGLVIFRCSATLYFANAEIYMDHLLEKSGVDEPKLLSLKKKLEAKGLRGERKETTQAKGEAPEMSDKEEKYAVAVVMSPEHDQSPDPTIPKAIILDLSPVNFLDTVGVKTLRSIQKQFGDAGIKVFLSGCQRCVIDHLEKGDFFNDKVTKTILFSTVHDAVLHCQGETHRRSDINTHPLIRVMVMRKCHV
ncbi:solute carrier family 26 member 6-like [Pangasianodon hypophthalmus]|uniref:solute carrier family 26 member 6-like n=1 Tax=Pangasianodon hypophthalmus TaxID=310915 RepID=UPI002307BB8F|nr:solute carrier family 26 member 6-like [Pangasianodon hypophthalmus]